MMMEEGREHSWTWSRQGTFTFPKAFSIFVAGRPKRSLPRQRAHESAPGLTKEALHR